MIGWITIQQNFKRCIFSLDIKNKKRLHKKLILQLFQTNINIGDGEL